MSINLHLLALYSMMHSGAHVMVWLGDTYTEFTFSEEANSVVETGRTGAHQRRIFATIPTRKGAQRSERLNSAQSLVLQRRFGEYRPNTLDDTTEVQHTPGLYSSRQYALLRGEHGNLYPPAP